METYWIIKKTVHEKFPYHLIVKQGREILLDLYVQDRWPGTKGNIFCLRANENEDKNSLKTDEVEIERTPVLNFRVFGKRLTVILNRPIKKRCSFLFLKKAYKNKPGEYEQIFWQTQVGLTQHKTKYKLAYNHNEKLKIIVDTAERYAWDFPSAETALEKLPVGDYAIKNAEKIIALVERKTFMNLMHEFGNMKKFHQQLHELETHRHAALIIEANYDDFLDNKKTAPYTAGFTRRAISELHAMHPTLKIIFAGSRKSAIIWTFSFFEAVASQIKDVPIQIAETR